MISELLTEAHMSELDSRDRAIGHRREWARLRKVERLERELAVARARLQTMFPAEAT